MNDISVEQFAAFLDGNLSEDEMEFVATAIDNNEEYTDILNDTMDIDSYVEMMGDDLSMPDFDLIDIDLPEIPEIIDDNSLVASPNDDVIIDSIDDNDVASSFNSIDDSDDFGIDMTSGNDDIAMVDDTDIADFDF